jgi:hypothetical protein
MIEELTEILGLHLLLQDHHFMRGLGFSFQVVEFLKQSLAERLVQERAEGLGALD